METKPPKTQDLPFYLKNLGLFNTQNAAAFCASLPESKRQELAQALSQQQTHTRGGRKTLDAFLRFYKKMVL